MGLKDAFQNRSLRTGLPPACVVPVVVVSVNGDPGGRVRADTIKTFAQR